MTPPVPDPEATMTAAVYRGKADVRIEQVPVPRLEAGEVLLQVAACGVCGTDIKKVALGLMAPPRIFGHETAGTIAAVGAGVSDWAPGDRVAVYHHVPEVGSWWSQRGLFAQDARYKQTGATAGFEAAGGGYAEYVRVLPWIVAQGGLVRLPERTPWEDAIFIEPVNTCLKGIRALGAKPGETALVIGAGSIGLLLMQLLQREGIRTLASDPLEGRRARALALGADRAVDPANESVQAVCQALTAGRGADHAVVAATGAAPTQDAIRATRPGARILLFASTYRGEEVPIDIGELCMSEKTLLGSYSASVDVAAEAARIVFDQEIDVRALISHRFPLAQTAEAIRVAGHPTDEVCKVVVMQTDADTA